MLRPRVQRYRKRLTVQRTNLLHHLSLLLLKMRHPLLLLLLLLLVVAGTVAVDVHVAGGTTAVVASPTGDLSLLSMFLQDPLLFPPPEPCPQLLPLHQHLHSQMEVHLLEMRLRLRLLHVQSVLLVLHAIWLMCFGSHRQLHSSSNSNSKNNKNNNHLHTRSVSMILLPCCVPCILSNSSNNNNKSTKTSNCHSAKKTIKALLLATSCSAQGLVHMHPREMKQQPILEAASALKAHLSTEVTTQVVLLRARTEASSRRRRSLESEVTRYGTSRHSSISNRSSLSRLRDCIHRKNPSSSRLALALDGSASNR